MAVRIHLSQPLGLAEFKYRLAGVDIFSMLAISALAPFEVDGEVLELDNVGVPAAVRLWCRTTGWIGGRMCQVECWSAPPGYLLKTEGASDIYISGDGHDVVWIGAHQNSASASQFEQGWLLGPVLVLAFALQGIWCLHASAVTRQGAVLAFLGESGRGKSTLSAYLSKTGAYDWDMAADDILPVAFGTSGWEARPQFPQLKLSADAQPGPHLPEKLSMRGFIVLAETRPDARVEWKRMPARQAAQALVRHTAGTRLFEPRILSEHLDFCARAAEQIPVYRVTYPHREDALLEVETLLEELC